VKELKKWKVAILIPYLLIIGWILIWVDVLASGNIGGIFFGGPLYAIGVILLVVYTIILVVALIVRWIILLRRRRAREPVSFPTSLFIEQTSLIQQSHALS
jgi:uncharacterized membrane protein